MVPSTILVPAWFPERLDTGGGEEGCGGVGLKQDVTASKNGVRYP
jgi:hypothetical protein